MALNKGIVYEAWGIRCYWVIQEYIYANLVKRYGLKTEGYSPEHASWFALYNLKQKGNRLTLTPSRFVSTTVDAMYQAMKNNPGLPNRERFVSVRRQVESQTRRDIRLMILSHPFTQSVLNIGRADDTATLIRDEMPV